MDQKTLARILIVKMSSLGDLFHALPTVHSLKTGLDAEIDWVVNSSYADTVACFDDVDRVIEFPRKNPLRDQAVFIRNLRERKYDLVCDLQGLLKSAYVARRARAARRIGPSFCREWAHLFYRETAGKKNKNRHAVDECLDLVRYLGLEIDQSRPPISFPTYPLELSAPIVAIAPRSRWETKNWPAHRFAEVGRRLAERGASICLVGGPAELEVCERISDAIGTAAVNLAGQTSIPELGGVLAAADLLLSVDSGPVHIAAALGTPVLGIYGITDPLRTGPYGDVHRIVRSPLENVYHGDFRRPSAANMEVMRAIKADTVAAAALDMLSDVVVESAGTRPGILLPDQLDR